MTTRRNAMSETAGGLAGILAWRTPPAFAQDNSKLKIGQLGLGSHNFVKSFNNPPQEFSGPVKCRPYAVWDDVPAAAKALKDDIGFERIIDDPATLVRECDVIHIEHADYRKVCELARPALELGKPTFINRPFAGTIADAEEIVRLARKHNAPLMCASTLEFQPQVKEIQEFIRDKGPLRAYEAYCPEPHFSWMFPHVFNFAHAALGGGIESAYFTGDYNMDLGKWVDDRQEIDGSVKWGFISQKFGAALCVLTYKSREGEPPAIGMNHIGAYPGSFHLDVYAAEENKLFEVDSKTIFNPMFETLHEFYVTGKAPRPYEAILEEHRALVAAKVSRLTGRAVTLSSLGGGDSLPYSEAIRRWLLRNFS